jgi:hypothetical protein
VPQRPTRCLLIGNTSAAEMRPIAAGLQAAFPAARLAIADRVLDIAKSANPADLYVVCQSWPDEYSEGEIAHLLSLSAAARLICVYGRWCDSEGRTRDRWPLAVRVNAARFPSRLEYELRVLSGEEAPLPLTASRGEIFAGTATYEARREAGA